MSWSDDMRCLYCDGKLPLYRKLTSGQFCSTGHRKSYWQEQERLAVERLHQTHDSLRAYRPAPPIESPQGSSVSAPSASDPLPSGHIYATPPLEPVENEVPAVELARSASNTGSVRFAGFLIEARPGPRTSPRFTLDFATEVALASWPADGFWMPPYGTGLSARELAHAAGVAQPLFNPTLVKSAVRLNAAANEEGFGFRPPVTPRFAAAPDTAEFRPEFLESAVELKPIAAEEQAPPFSETLLGLPQTAARAGETGPRRELLETLYSPAAPQLTASDTRPATPSVSQAWALLPLKLENAPQAHASLLTEIPEACELTPSLSIPKLPAGGDHVALGLMLAPGCDYPLSNQPCGRYEATVSGTDAAHSIELQSSAVAPQIALGRDAELGLNLAPLCRYSVSVPACEMREVAPRAIAAQPVSLPTKIEIVRLTDATGGDARIPTADRMLPLAFDAARLAPLDPAGRHAIVAQPVDLLTKFEIVGLPDGWGASTEVPAANRMQPLALGRPAQGTEPGTHPITAQPVDLSTKFAIVPLPAGMGANARLSVRQRLFKLAFHMTPRVPATLQLKTGSVLNEYPANKPMWPVTKWQPIEGEAVPTAHKSFLTGWTPGMSGEGTNVLQQAADFWKHAPRDMKLLVVAIPILLGLALRPSLPKVRVTAPTSSTQIQGTLERGFHAQMLNVRRTVAERAGVALSEEFRSGLDDWQSRGDLSTAWSFDSNGFVRPGSLALYRPSMGLRDYELQFLGLIDKKALSWVVRAADFDNYYVIKLVVTKPGPLPTIGITRYAVINGQAQNRVDTIAAINARPDMLYRVSLNVSENTYLLTLQGVVVDTWSEPRLKTGGVGFFSPRGEESRLRWVQVTHQYDMLGRLCAYLAPYDIPNTNGSW